jgi:hypothetical protein
VAAIVFSRREPRLRVTKMRADLTTFTTFFELTYNHHRLHSALRYETPAGSEQQLCASPAQASTELSGARQLTTPRCTLHSPAYNLARHPTVPSSLSQLGVQSTRLSPYFFCPVFPAPVFPPSEAAGGIAQNVTTVTCRK